MRGRKLQVFVSSTYKDLQAERAAAVQAILRARHIPAGMELFAAGDKSQWETIKRWIDDCDVFLLVLGERYGSIEPDTGKSYVQLEYEYALDRGKRYFALVLDDRWVRAKYRKLGAEASDEHRYKHKEFKELVLSRMSDLVRDLGGIREGVITSLQEIDQDENLSGWVKGSDLVASQRRIDDLNQRIEELQGRSQAATPTPLDIANALDAVTRELRQKSFARQVELSVEGDGRAKTYELKASGLGLLWRNRGVVRRGKIPRPANEWTLDLIDWILPHMEIWGLLTPRGTGHLLTAKGKMLMDRVDALSQEEVGNPQYAPLERARD